MQKNTSSSRIGIRYKILAILFGTVLITVLLFSFLVLPMLPRTAIQKGNALKVVLTSGLILFVVTLAAYRVLHLFIRRIDRIDEVTRAWLRGNLSLLINDDIADELGIITENLDQLAGHLEEDEEDLSRLSQSNTRLTDQVRALAVVEERNRLARELHDSVKQHLFSLAMTASAIKTRFMHQRDIPDDVMDMVDEIVSASQHAQQETTRLIEDLRPGSLEERGLAAALNDYTLLFGAQEHLLVYLDVNCNDQEIPPTVAEALYRIAQESLHNVARHAHATRVDVALQCIDNSVVLTIEDNGVGFDTTNVQQGLGISNMQERLLSVGGRLSIESQHSIGTEVKAEVRLITQPAGNVEDVALSHSTADFSQWLWLGQNLVIPVGQTWPWLPDDEERHLTGPVISPTSSPLVIRKENRLLAIRTAYTFRSSEQRYPICRIVREKSGFTWDDRSATWDLKYMRGLNGRGVLFRNEQPLAALQYQGRQMHSWTQIVYHTQIYNLTINHDNRNIYILNDYRGRVYLEILKSDMVINIHHPVALPLIVIAVSRFLDESSVNQVASTMRS